MTAPVLIDDDHPDFDHIEAAPCTHTAVTAEHLARCCRDGVDCDICGHLIPGLVLDPRNGPDQVIVCSDCADLEEI